MTAMTDIDSRDSTDHREKMFRSIVMKRVALGVILSVIIGSCIIQIVPGSGFGTSVTQGQEIAGSPGASIIQEDTAGVFTVTLANTTDFSEGSGWFVDEHPEGYLQPWAFSYWQESDGLHISARSSCSIALWFGSTLLVDYQDRVDSVVSMACLEGSVSTETRIDFGSGWSGTSVFSNNTSIDAGMSGLCVVTVSTEELGNLSEGWEPRLTFSIVFTMDRATTVLVDWARITASSNEPLYPITLDVRDLDGLSLFDAPGSIPVFSLPLRINGSHEHCSVFRVRESNQSVFVHSGNYTIEYGWFTSTSPTPQGSISFAIGSEQTLVDISVLAVRLYFDSSPDIPLYLFFDSSVYFQFPYSLPLYGMPVVIYMYFVPKYDSFIFLPPDLGPVSIMLRVFKWQADLDLEVSHTHHLVLHAKPPVVSFFGLAFSDVQLFLVLLVSGLGISSIVSLSGAAAPFPIMDRLRRPGVLSLLILIVSYFSPWAVMEQFSPSSTTEMWSYPSGLIWSRYEQSATFVYFDFEVMHFVEPEMLILSRILVFWLPALVLLFMVAVGRVPKVRFFMPAVVAVPAALSSIEIVRRFLEGGIGTLLFGFYLPLLSLFVLLLQLWKGKSEMAVS